MGEAVHRGLITCAIVIVTGTGCTILFSGGSEPAETPDASTACLSAQQLPENVDIERAQALDINGDGIDEIAVIGRGASDPQSQVFVQFGQCVDGKAESFSFQEVWLPQDTEGNPIDVHELLALDVAVGHRVAGIGTVGLPDEGEFRVFSAPVVGGFIGEVDFSESLATRVDNGKCVLHRGPYRISRGNFDADFDDLENDLIFSSEQQTYIFEIANWETPGPPPWNRSCVQPDPKVPAVEEVGDPAHPRRIFGPASRFSYLISRGTGTDVDQLAEVRRVELQWFDPPGETPSRHVWDESNRPVVGGTTVESDFKDDVIDGFSWSASDPEQGLRIYAATVQDFGTTGVVEIVQHPLDIVEPSGAHLLRVDGQEFGLLLSANKLYLMNLDSGAFADVKDLSLFVETQILRDQQMFFYDTDGQSQCVAVVTIDGSAALADCE